MRTMIVTLLFVLINTLAFATQEKKTAKIRITGPGGFLDETTIYFDLGVIPAYTSTQDAPKTYGTIPEAPSIYSLSSDNVFCSINGYSELGVSEIVPLGIRTVTDGGYIFSATLLTNFDSSSIIRLEDRVQNIFTDLRTDNFLVLLGDSETLNGRFFLHVSRAIRFSSDTAGCANNDGVLQIDGDNSIIWTNADLLDSTGYVIGSFENISGAYIFSDLPESAYSLALTYSGYTFKKALYVNGKYVEAHIQPSTLTAVVNQEIVFQTEAHNATDYQWDLGDSTRITGVANLTYAFVQPGIYKVVLLVSNAAGCEHKDSVSISVSAATSINNVSDRARNIWAYDKTITVVLNEEIKQGAELKIYNILGQPVYYNPVLQSTTEIILADQPTGYYIVALQNNKIESARRVFIGR